MTGNQGALNHLLAGDFGTAVHDVEVSIGNLFHDSVVPALKVFITQFVSDFGSQALSAAAPLALQVIAGSITMTEAGTQLAEQLGPLAITDAEKDGTVALNAIRVQITAAQTTPVVVAPVVTPDAPVEPTA